MAAMGHVVKVTGNKSIFVSHLSNLLKITRHVSQTEINKLKLHTASRIGSSSVLYQRSSINSRGPTTQPTDAISSTPNCKIDYDPVLVQELLAKMKDDFPLPDMPDPFAKDYHRCFLCRHNVQLDHKNIRLLSQFISPFTGRIYGRAITGLCIPMQKYVSRLIKRARFSGYMAYMFKDPKYIHDPQPYDTMAKKVY